MTILSYLIFRSIRDLRRIRNTLDSTTAKNIAKYLIHSKVDYCNSLFLNFPHSQLDRLPLILNFAARAVSKTPRFTHITSVLKSLQWLKIDQRIHYYILSITYETLQSRKSSYLHNFTLALVLLPCTVTLKRSSFLSNQNNAQIINSSCIFYLECSFKRILLTCHSFLRYIYIYIYIYT